MEIPLIALHSDSEFLLPQAPPSLFDPGDEPTQRAPVATPDADLRFDADQQIPPRVLQQHIRAAHVFDVREAAGPQLYTFGRHCIDSFTNLLSLCGFLRNREAD